MIALRRCCLKQYLNDGKPCTRRASDRGENSTCFPRLQSYAISLNKHLSSARFKGEKIHSLFRSLYCQ